MLEHLNDVYEGIKNNPESAVNNDATPDGQYEVTVTEAVVKMTKREPLRPMLAWTMKIDGPTYAGRYEWKNDLLDTPARIERVVKELAICGMTLDKFSDLETRATELEDMKLEIEIKTNKGYRYTNIVRALDAAPVEEDAPIGVGENIPEEDIPF